MKMNDLELTTILNSVACAVADCVSIEELNFLSAAFTQLGDTLATIAARRNLCQSKGEKSSPK